MKMLAANSAGLCQTGSTISLLLPSLFPVKRASELYPHGGEFRVGLHPGHKILPIRGAFCSYTNWARRFAYFRVRSQVHSLANNNNTFSVRKQLFFDWIFTINRARLKHLWRLFCCNKRRGVSLSCFCLKLMTSPAFKCPWFAEQELVADIAFWDVSSNRRLHIKLSHSSL